MSVRWHSHLGDCWQASGAAPGADGQYIMVCSANGALGVKPVSEGAKPEPPAEPLAGADQPPDPAPNGSVTHHGVKFLSLPHRHRPDMPVAAQLSASCMCMLVGGSNQPLRDGKIGWWNPEINALNLTAAMMIKSCIKAEFQATRANGKLSTCFGMQAHSTAACAAGCVKHCTGSQARANTPLPQSRSAMTNSCGCLLEGGMHHAWQLSSITDDGRCD